MNTLQDEAKAFEAISLDAGVVDAQNMCNALWKGSSFIQDEVISLEYIDDFWLINGKTKAKNVEMSISREVF